MSEDQVQNNVKTMLKMKWIYYNILFFFSVYTECQIKWNIKKKVKIVLSSKAMCTFQFMIGYWRENL